MNAEHGCLELIQSNVLLAVASIISLPEISDMTKVMSVSDRLFLVFALMVFAFAAYEVWQQYQRISELHRTHPDKWPKTPVLPASINLYAKPDQRR